MKPFTTIAALLLALIAVAHILRMILGWEITLDGTIVPAWVSLPGFIIPALLSVMLWREMGK
jgi:hypothetical protein